MPLREFGERLPPVGFELLFDDPRRIQEFEASAPGKSPHSDGPRIAVEMWDTSGDFVK